MRVISSIDTGEFPALHERLPHDTTYRRFFGPNDIFRLGRPIPGFGFQLTQSTDGGIAPVEFQIQNAD